MFKKCTAILLAMLLVLGCFPATAAASEVVAQGNCGDNLTWVFTDDGTLTISGTGSIPGYGFDDSRPWEAYRYDVTRLVMESGITGIGGVAFSDFFKLTSVVFPDTLLSISNLAFENCVSLTEVHLPDSLTKLGAQVFLGCRSLKTIKLPESLTSIGEGVFWYCTSLESITISEYVTSIGESPCLGCTSLTGIHVDENNPNYSSDGAGVLFNKQQSELIQFPGAFSGTYSIPDSVSKVRPYSFSRCTLTGVVIPNSVTEIGDRAFNNCVNLTQIQIPDSVVSLGNYPFSGCSSLTGIHVGANNPNYSNDEFGVLFDKQKTQMIEVPDGISGEYTIPGSITEIGYGMFENCFRLTCITIPGSVTNVKNQVFAYTGQLRVVFLGNAPTFSSSTFYENRYQSNVGAKDVYYPQNNETWTQDVLQQYGGQVNWVPYTGDYPTFAERFSWELENGVLTVRGIGPMPENETPWLEQKDSIHTVVVENGITAICANAFQQCGSLTSVSLPDSVTRIGDGAFSDCSSLEQIHLLDSITYIGDGAFSGCSSLAQIHLPDNLLDITTEVFKACSNLTDIVIPEGVTRIGESAFEGCSSLSQVQIPQSVKSISDDAFNGCQSLTDIALPDDLSHLGGSAFANCSSLKSIIIPDGISDIQERTFEDCTSLTSVVIPDSVVRISFYAFLGCSSLKSIAIPAGVESIGTRAFGSCNGLTGIHVDPNNPHYFSDASGVLYDKLQSCLIHTPALLSGEYTIVDGTSWIEDYAFDNCINLTKVTIPDSVTQVGTFAFNDCESLEEVVLSKSMTEIPEGAFQDCSKLVNITIPDTITRINSTVFQNCSSLTDIRIPDSVTDIGIMVFYGCTSLKQVELSQGIAKIPFDTFHGCSSLTDVVIPDSVTGIGLQSFMSCSSLTDIVLPDSVTDIETSAFANCTNLERVTLSPNITDISEYAFWGCRNLTDITIPEGVVRIEEAAFGACRSLQDIIIPASVTNIEEHAFESCFNLSAITFVGDAPEMGEYVFDFVEATAYYPADNDTWTADVMQNYGGSIIWVAYSPEEGLPGEIGGSCSDTTSWTLAEGILTISPMEPAEGAVLPTAVLSSEECLMPDYAAVTQTPWYPFRERIDCVVISDGVGHVGSNAFSAMPKLNNVYIGKGVASIGTGSFAACPTVETITFCGDAPAMDASAFDQTTASICYPADNTSWSDSVLDCFGDESTYAPYEGEPPAAPKPEASPFADVQKGKFYYESVLWAVDAGITNGTSATEFSPDATCTRGQVVTFLWRAAGCPEPTVTEHPFTDVKKGAFYYKAMLWAVEQGITNGVTATTFEPGKPCDRGTVVTFLWRAEGKPAPASAEHPFTDVKAGKFYYDAMLWAVENGITSGMTKTTFAPDTICNRGQVVTFLYRACAE